MANEITISGGLSVAKGTLKASLTGTEKKDMAGSHYIQRVDDIGTGEETVGKGDIVTLGYVAFKNVGSTGVIRVGGATGAYAVTLDPGEFVGPVKWATNAIYAIGDTAGCRLEMLLLEA